MKPEARAWSALAALAVDCGDHGRVVVARPVAGGTVHPRLVPANARRVLWRALNSLPNAGGWLLLVGQPIGLLVLLTTVWTAELRAGLALAMSRLTGQVLIGVASAALVAGVAGVVVRVAGWDDARVFGRHRPRHRATADARER